MSKSKFVEDQNKMIGASPDDIEPAFLYDMFEEDDEQKARSMQKVALFNQMLGMADLDASVKAKLKEAKPGKYGIDLDLDNGHKIQYQALQGGQEIINFAGKPAEFTNYDAQAIISLCKSKGWGVGEKDGKEQTICVHGGLKQKELLWLEAQRQGLKVGNFAPMPGSAVALQWEQEKGQTDLAAVSPANNPNTPPPPAAVTPDTTSSTPPPAAPVADDTTAEAEPAPAQTQVAKAAAPVSISPFLQKSLIAEQSAQDFVLNTLIQEQQQKIAAPTAKVEAVAETVVETKPAAPAAPAATEKPVVQAAAKAENSKFVSKKQKQRTVTAAKPKTDTKSLKKLAAQARPKH